MQYLVVGEPIEMGNVGLNEIAVSKQEEGGKRWKKNARILRLS